MVRHYVGLGAEPTRREAYNPLQKLAYSSTLFLGALAVATGVLLAKPVQCAPIVDALGGFAAIRMYHFAVMLGFVAFVPGHLVMVVLHGWGNFTSMVTGWKRRPSYLSDSVGGDQVKLPDPNYSPLDPKTGLPSASASGPISSEHWVTADGSADEQEASRG